MGMKRRGRGDMAFSLPRSIYEKTPIDDARPDPKYRPPLQLSAEQTCYVCGETIPAGSTGVRWASRRRRWRHDGCRWDLMPAS